MACLARVADGVRIRRLSRPNGINEVTIRAWRREAGRHADDLEAALLDKYRRGPAPIDGLGTDVGRKATQKRRPRAG